MITTLDALWDDGFAPGVYRLKSRRSPERVRDDVAAHGWQCFVLDGREIDDKATFLRACAASMRFPAYFGYNWDAFADSLTDLSWAPAAGYVVLYHHTHRFALQHPDDWVTAHDIFVEAAVFWGSRGVPFYVLLQAKG